MRRNWVLLVILFTSLVPGTNPGSAALISTQKKTQPTTLDLEARVDPWVLRQVEDGQAEFFLFLDEQADLSLADAVVNKVEKGRYIYETLSRTALQTQKPLIQELERLGISYRSYWIANMIWIQGDKAELESLALQPAVRHIFANPMVRGQIPAQNTAAADTAATGSIEWNLLKVEADKVWAMGDQGQNVVIGGQDTGYDWNHPSLHQQYRGWEGSSADHNYNWHDAIHADNPATPLGNPCGFDSREPCDDYGHGTHTMGIMAGSDGGSNQIGMAPQARWIGCRNMEQGWGTPASYIECYQWFAAPTDLDGKNPDPSKAPDIINNSWSCPASEGCSDPTMLQTVVENVRAAGILSVQSAGNSGPNCSTIDTPAAIYDASFTIANTTASDTLATRSSRGPVMVDGSGRMKPDAAAPGTNIRSAWLYNGYTILSGTSMAAPHVAGLAALLIAAQPGLGGKVDDLEKLITQTAAPLTGAVETCGGIASSTIPNNSYGWGRINAWQAYLASFPYHYYWPAIYAQH